MAKEISFRELETELEVLLERVEHASYDELEDLLKDCEQGKKLITQLEKRLETVSNTIKKSKKS